MATSPGGFTQSSRLWTLFLVSTFLHFFFANEADNDLWGHVLFGRDLLAHGALARTDTYSYTAPGAPWVNHEWLAQTLFALVYSRGGGPALLGFKVALAAVTCGIGFTVVRRRTTTTWAAGVAGVLTMSVLARGFAVRPQIFTYAATAGTLALLDAHARGRRTLWLLPVLMIPWVNLHGGFIVGLALVGVMAASTSLRRQPGAAGLWTVFVVMLLCTTVNPYGLELPVYVWHELSRSHPITEWEAVALRDTSQAGFLAVLLLFLLTLPWIRERRADGWLTAAALGAAGLALRHQRHTPLFALCVAAPLAGDLEAAAVWAHTRWSASLGRTAQRLVAVGLGAIVAVQVWSTVARWHRDGLQLVFDPADYPVGAVHALASTATTWHIALPLEWGEYALWFLAPQSKVSLDGRFATVYPDVVVQDNFDFFTGAPGWRRLLEDYPTDAVLVPTGWPNHIRDLAGWQRVYGDTVAQVYVRDDRARGLPALPAVAVTGPPTFP